MHTNFKRMECAVVGKKLNAGSSGRKGGITCTAQEQGQDSAGNSGRMTEDESDEWTTRELNHKSKLDDTATFRDEGREGRRITHCHRAWAQYRNWSQHRRRHLISNSFQSQRELRGSPIGTRERGQPMQGPFPPFGRRPKESRRRSGPYAQGKGRS